MVREFLDNKLCLQWRLYLYLNKKIAYYKCRQTCNQCRKTLHNHISIDNLRIGGRLRVYNHIIFYYLICRRQCLFCYILGSYMILYLYYIFLYWGKMHLKIDQ